ncbi:GNAT family N-acetyltransferase [Nocardioides marmoraquaticus]
MTSFSEVGPDDLDDLVLLFDRHRATRRCWCTTFCLSGRDFAVGWVVGRNRRRLAETAEASAAPVGIVARIDSRPVAWAACGPRGRYTTAIAGRSALLQHTDRAEDDDVWLLPCVFVDAAHRGTGLVGALVHEVVDVARRHGARAVEAWPSTAGPRSDATDFVGRASTFAAAGFVTVAEPEPGRRLVRREL